MSSRYDENGDYIVDPPQSRIEQRLSAIEKLIKEGGGGGGDVPPDDPANTASASDVEDIKDSIQW